QRPSLLTPFPYTTLFRSSGRTLLRFRQCATDDGNQLLEIERLGQIFISAPLGRADRRHECVLGAHDHDRQFGPQFLDARQEIERDRKSTRLNSSHVSISY